MATDLNNVLDIEQKLLALLIAQAAEDSPFLTEVLSSSEDIDWARFEALVKRHRVGALIHEGLTNFPVVKPPQELLRIWAQATTDNATHFMRAVKVTSELVKAFEADGISCALLKGIGVASRHYAVPSQREMIDIDILVDPERYRAAEDIVIAQGFTRFYPKAALKDEARPGFMALHNAFAFIRSSDGAQLDLHWRMVQHPAMLPAIDRTWPANVTPAEVAGQRIPMLNPAFHFVYVCVHGAKSGWARLKWLVDVDRMARNLSDQEAAAARDVFEANGLERIAAVSLILSRRILGTPVPDVFADMIGRNPASKLITLELPMIFDELPSRPHQLSDWRHFIDRFHHSLILHRGKGYRRGALLRELARPRDLETIALGPRSLWLLAVISPVLGVKRAVKRLFGKA